MNVGQSSRRSAVVEPLILLGLCVIALGPAHLLSGQALGAPTRDLFDHLALLDVWSLRVDDWNLPRGGTLVPPDLFGMILAAPWLEQGRALAYNLAVLAQLWLATLAAWLLGRRVGSGLVAGVGFGLSPYLLGQAMSGEAETLSAWPLPIVAWLLCQRDRRAWLGAGLVGAVAAIGSWYYGAYAALGVTLWTLVRGRWWRADREPAVLLAPLGFAVAVIGPALVYARILHGSEQLFAGPDMATYLAEQPRALAAMSADPLAWFGAPSPGATAHTDSLGLVTLGLALWGARRWPQGRWWLGVAGVGALLSVGPVLHLAGSPVLSWTPYRLMVDLPLLGLMRLPHRWTVVTTLGLAVLAARGARDLPRLAALFVFVETVLFLAPPVQTTDIRPPAVTDAITGPVLDLPPRVLGDDARGRYLVWQRTHRQAIPYALLMQGWSPELAQEPLMIAVAAMDSRDPIVERAAEARQFRQGAFALAVRRWRARADADALGGANERLWALGLRQVVLHQELLDPDDQRPVLDVLSDALGAPRAVGSARLWDLHD